MTKLGINETLDVIALIEKIGDVMEKVAEDGQVSLSDIQYLPSLAYPAKEAIEGAGMIEKELRNLDGEEAKEILTKLLPAIYKLVTAAVKIEK